MFEQIKADLDRLKESENASRRVLVAGILSQGFQALIVYRFFNWCHRHKIPAQPFRFFIERFVEITTGISLPAQCTIGRGFRIHHFGGIIFHSGVELGDHCTVYHDVTIGDRGGSGPAPRLGNSIIVGAGAKLIGDIRIGDNCIIGANAVVTKDMPPDTIAVGNPAIYKSKRNDKDN
jgi:serine O-acetyltransferase